MEIQGGRDFYTPDGVLLLTVLLTAASFKLSQISSTEHTELNTLNLLITFAAEELNI